MTLRELAHARAGDKGETINISVIAYDKHDYAAIAAAVTPERVREHLAELIDGPVVRYELPQLGALNFVMRRARGGVTRTLALDAHGKSFSSAILAMEIEVLKTLRD